MSIRGAIFIICSVALVDVAYSAPLDDAKAIVDRITPLRCEQIKDRDKASELIRKGRVNSPEYKELSDKASKQVPDLAKARKDDDRLQAIAKTLDADEEAALKRYSREELERCLKAASASSGDATEPQNSALSPYGELMRNKQYKAGLDFLGNAAKSGDARAKSMLFDLYNNVLNGASWIPPEVTKPVLDHLEVEASLGDADSQYILAVMYLKKYPAERFADGIRLLNSAADAGNVAALMILGSFSQKDLESKGVNSKYAKP